MNTLDSLTVTKVHPHIGAEIGGIDVARPISDELFDRIRDAFNEYSVLVFRNQRIDDDQQTHFSERFGPLEEISFGQLGAPNIYVYHLSNTDARGRILSATAKKRTVLKVNSRWHTDSSFKEIPAMASILSGREIPSRERADTEFASMRVGYETLAAAKQNAVQGLFGVHHYAYSLNETGDGGVPKTELDALPPVRHPLVRVHPGTGRPSLFVSGHIEAIEGMPKQEGIRFAEELIAWCTRPGYVYSHEWRQHDLVIWDNRCVLHRAGVVPEREVRRAHRTTVLGEGPVEAYSIDGGFP